jgi:hypothetical protein
MAHKINREHMFLFVRIFLVPWEKLKSLDELQLNEKMKNVCQKA